jgi:hypothetical protein
MHKKPKEDTAKERNRREEQTNINKGETKAQFKKVTELCACACACVCVCVCVCGLLPEAGSITANIAQNGTITSDTDLTESARKGYKPSRGLH